MKTRLFGYVLAALAALPFYAAAQDKGELWEISSQMNIPGMPAGMGSQTQRVCQGDDPERSAANNKDREKCRVTDRKQTATRTSVSMTCPDGTMTIEQTYNAARTEFKGVMKMNSKQGDMTINTAGRKVGTCDVAQTRRERDEKMAAVKKQVEANPAAAKPATEPSNGDAVQQGINQGMDKLKGLFGR